MPKSYEVCYTCFTEVWAGYSLKDVEGEAIIPETPEYYAYATELYSFDACPGCNQTTTDRRRWRVEVKS